MKMISNKLTIALLTLPLLIASQAQAADMTDQRISDAVEDELLFDPAVPLNDIDVVTHEGIVTLSGDVNSLLAKSRASRLAESVKGVRTIVNRMTVDPPMDRSDRAIRNDVIAALASNPATEAYELNLSVDDAEVELTGTVQSWQELTLASKVAAGVKGVTDVENQISVNYKAERPDFELRPEIERALRWDTLVDHELIDVSVQNGQVALSGTVGSAAEKRRARYDALVNGVKGVNAEDLDVRKWARDEDLRKTKYKQASPDEIKTAIEKALMYDPRVSSFEVQADVTGSIVTLRGNVDNLKAKRAAAQVARNTVGVSAVTNRLKVRPAQDTSADEIAEEVRSALARDPYVDRFEISVSVVDNTAYLSGTVDSYFEKGQADDIAATTPGVTEVVNTLKVDYTAVPLTYDPYVDEDYLYEAEWYDYEPYYTFESDTEIKSEINDELWWSPFVDSDDVDVSVENGTATLEGTVDSWSERSAATENAYEGGATWVINNLDVE
jgi:osmotically-inducible protein OsmY